jgi:hypothetical protein
MSACRENKNTVSALDIMWGTIAPPRGVLTKGRQKKSDKKSSKTPSMCDICSFLSWFVVSVVVGLTFLVLQLQLPVMLALVLQQQVR